MNLSTGVGSMPGTDYTAAVDLAVANCFDFMFLPELPGRGPHAGIIGRTAAILAELNVDLTRPGWRLTDHGGKDQRRAQSFLVHDLDVLEEYREQFDDRLKIQVCGPWTMAAQLLLPRGERVMSDHGARRDLAHSLVEGVRAHIADVQRRTGISSLTVQIDEPGLTAVLYGRIRTASGLHRYRAIDRAEVGARLSELVSAIHDAGGSPVIHNCDTEPPVSLFRESGFAAVSCDLNVISPNDDWAAAIEAGIELWPGVVPTTQGDGSPSAELLAKSIQEFLHRLGFQSPPSPVVVTPSCGLAGASPLWAGRALELGRQIAGQLNR